MAAPSPVQPPTATAGLYFPFIGFARNPHRHFMFCRLHAGLDAPEVLMLRFTNRPRRPRPQAPVRPASKWRRFFGSRRLFDTVLLGVTFVAAARLVSAAVAHPPPVAMPGDIIPIERAANWMGGVTMVKAHNLGDAFAAPGSACELNIRHMAKSGGSFTVLAVRADGVMLSWAGGPTAAPGQACAGGQTGVLVSDADYRSLLMRVPAGL
jgi:hypothetical protein